MGKSEFDGGLLGLIGVNVLNIKKWWHIPIIIDKLWHSFEGEFAIIIYVHKKILGEYYFEAIWEIINAAEWSIYTI